jgi:hypothetical protein
VRSTAAAVPVSQPPSSSASPSGTREPPAAQSQRDLEAASAFFASKLDPVCPDDRAHRRLSRPVRVEPICATLQIAPSTYYAAKTRPPCQRTLRDEWLCTHIRRVYDANYQVYGARKIWRQLHRQDIAVARATVERGMRQLGIQGAVRGAPKRTTVAEQAAQGPADLVRRDLPASRPNRLWSPT